jgi:hypothetical protein
VVFVPLYLLLIGPIVVAIFLTVLVTPERRVGMLLCGVFFALLLCNAFLHAYKLVGDLPRLPPWCCR